MMYGMTDYMYEKNCLEKKKKMSRENVIMIGVVALLIVVIIVVRFVIKSVINKGADAIHNARVKSSENNPPKKESLAKRYENKSDEMTHE